MSYKWANEKKLDTLKVKGSDNVLYFEAGDEKAVVYLKDEDILKVEFSLSGEKTVIHNKDAYHIVVGENNWQRDVYHYLKPKGPAPTLRLGITKHKGKGTWSSLPHSFELNPELGFEEVFFYMIKGGYKKAIQVGKGVWFDGSSVDTVWQVEDYSFSTIPMGYHPVGAEPETEVLYVWAYLCKKPSWEKI